MKINIEQVHKKLTQNIEEYVLLILNEYGTYMPQHTLQKLKSIRDFSQVLQIYDYGEVNAKANEEHIMMPLCADRLLNLVSKVPGYGINKGHKPYNNENMVLNNNTFLTYIKHVFVSGTDAEGYYDDLLLHETMHFCGSDGSSVLKEGINELLTRMLAKKYNLRTNSCGYPKEVKLSYRLMETLGEDTIKQLAFISGLENEINFINAKLGSDVASMYQQVSILAEQEFYTKYYSHMNEFDGFSGIIKKTMMYNQIDYSNIYKIIDDYCKNLNVETSYSKN